MDVFLCKKLQSRIDSAYLYTSHTAKRTVQAQHRTYILTNERSEQIMQQTPKKGNVQRPDIWVLFRLS